MRFYTTIVYFVFLVLGIHAAYAGNLAVAVFFAIVCTSENIAVSIDYWPGIKQKHHKKPMR